MNGIHLSRLPSMLLPLVLVCLLAAPAGAVDSEVQIYGGLTQLSGVVGQKRASPGIWLDNGGYSFGYHTQDTQSEAEHEAFHTVAEGDTVFPAVHYQVEAGGVLTLGRDAHVTVGYGVLTHVGYAPVNAACYTIDPAPVDVYGRPVVLENTGDILLRGTRPQGAADRDAYTKGTTLTFYTAGIYIVALDEHFQMPEGTAAEGMRHGDPKALLVEVIGSVQPPAAYPREVPLLVDGIGDSGVSAFALKDEYGNETNYMAVRDVARLLDGTEAQFDVTWDGAVNLIDGAPYSGESDRERPESFAHCQPYEANAAETRVGGGAVQMESILLKDTEGNGHTYYKLRDLGSALGFQVDWGTGDQGGFIAITT